jgi:hypothetical protein
MALKTMVTDNFVLAMTKFLEVLSTRKGNLYLAMLVPSESGLSDKWNLVLSGKWIDEEGLQATIPKISSLLLSHVPKNHAAKIERISVLRTSDALITELALLNIPLGTAYRIHASAALTLRGIEDSIVLIAQKKPSQAASKIHAAKTRMHS